MVRLLIILVLLAVPAFAQEWELGYQNPDGSQDTYNMKTNTWKYGYQNPDGSQDTYNTRTRSWEYGYKNPDGSQNTYRTKSRRRYRGED